MEHAFVDGRSCCGRAPSEGGSAGQLRSLHPRSPVQPQVDKTEPRRRTHEGRGDRGLRTSGYRGAVYLAGDRCDVAAACTTRCWRGLRCQLPFAPNSSPRHWANNFTRSLNSYFSIHRVQEVATMAEIRPFRRQASAVLAYFPSLAATNRLTTRAEAELVRTTSRGPLRDRSLQGTSRCARLDRCSRCRV